MRFGTFRYRFRPLHKQTVNRATVLKSKREASYFDGIVTESNLIKYHVTRFSNILQRFRPISAFRSTFPTYTIPFRPTRVCLVSRKRLSPQASAHRQGRACVRTMLFSPRNTTSKIV